ncbi:isopeptide-forming domain-containing fimbrial protein [Bifidobacterium castoris]|nr:isopeptide-forming domain-containing fimbrial protein [Bifidobacterium castoris]
MEGTMKKKEIIAALGALAAIAGMGFGASANAAEITVPDNGKITIAGATSVQHNLVGYRLASYASADVDGTTLNSFTVTTDAANKDKVVAALTADQNTALQASVYKDNPMAWVVENMSAAQLRQFAMNLQQNAGLTGGVSFKIGENAVPTGYYLVTDQTEAAALDGKPETVSNPMLLSTTVGDATVDAAGNTLGSVNLKNSSTEIHKQVVKAGAAGYVSNEQPDYAVGDEVTYELTSKTPNFDGYNIDPTLQDAKKTRVFKIVDTMSKGLTYNSIESVKVNGITLKDTDYTVVSAAAADKDGAYQGGTVVSIDLAKYVNKAPGSTGEKLAEIPAGMPVSVIVKATLNKDALISTPDAIQANPNKVDLEFSHNPSDTSQKTTTPGGEVNVYTFKLQMLKTDKSGQTPLKGAEFTIKTTAADNNQNVNKYLAAKDKDGKWTYTDSEDNALRFTSDDKGVIAGIDGIDAGTYEIHETKAPEGFLRADLQAIKFTVTVAPTYKADESTKPAASTTWGDQTATTEVVEEGTGDTGNMVAKDGKILYQFDVANAKNLTQLPLTGATGMRALTIVAIVAIGVGLLLMVRARRLHAVQ